MNTNLNDIPLEIYLDYISEITQQEWNLETLTTISYSTKFTNSFHYQHGCDICHIENATGNGFVFGYERYGYGYNGSQEGNGLGFGFGSLNEY